MKFSHLLVATGLVLSTNVCAHALSLTLENNTQWEIHELYFSPNDQESWGPDQLGDEVISKGEAFKLSKIDKGEYDVKIVDEDGDVCKVNDVNFAASETVSLSDKDLLGCQENSGD